MAKKKADQERTPDEISAMTRAVMGRMLATPPVPHERISGNGKRKTGKRKRTK